MVDNKFFVEFELTNAIPAHICLQDVMFSVTANQFQQAQRFALD